MDVGCRQQPPHDRGYRQRSVCIKRFHFPSDQMTLSVSDDAGGGGGNCTFDRERETKNPGEGSVGLNGQGHHIHLTWRGPSFFLIVILTILFFMVGLQPRGRGDFII